MSDVAPEALRAFRQDAGLSVVDAARELARQASPGTLPGVDSIVRSWKRWEAGAKPSRLYEPFLSELLARARTPPGNGDAAVNLSGEWWAAWETYRDGQVRYSPQLVRVRQEATELRFWAVSRGVPVEVGGYLWSGEMRLWDNEILIGWYAADDGSVRSKGSVYFHMHPHGQSMWGRWVGLSYDGPVVTGLGVMARTRPRCEAIMQELVDKERQQRGPHR